MLFFIHIPKAAGTSLRSLLQASLGNRLVPTYAGANADWDPVRIVSNPPPDDSVLFGHFVWGFHQRLHKPPRYAVVLRHPVDRVLSWYNWTKQGRRLPLHKEVTSGVPLARILDSGVLPLSNQMVEYVAGKTPEALDDFDTLRLAKQNLRNCEFVSTLELLDSDLLRLGALLGVDCGSLPHENKSRLHSNLDEETRRTIMRHNVLDFQLYTLAQRIALRQRDS